jgi:hypothetical protein
MRIWHCTGPVARLALALGFCLTAAAAPPIEVKDGFYHLDGHRVFINAIGYESGARPGEAPYLKPDRDLAQVRRDLARIKDAGFNGIRTWSEMPEAELQVVQASGLKVVFGIWLKPDEDFGDPKVVEKDLALLRKVLAYTRKYSCIITYLIMNEPMPEHLRKVGAQPTRDLWTRSVDLIHQLHPGVPVTISGNTAITEWVDMNLFDVYGRNVYDYKDGANFTHGCAQAQLAITGTLGQGKPVLVTEFGRSVSRRGSDFYGGNTLQEQADAMVRYYRDFLDAGVAGLCPFYYADGWWKAGREAIHDDEAEEWFGFIGFKDLKDTVGLPRPAWHALKQYNQCLLTSPRNQAFYQNQVPIEAFCQPEVKKLRVVSGDAVLLELVPDPWGRCEGMAAFPGEDLKDRELVFETLDRQGRLLKVETLLLLTGRDPVQWPTLELTTPVTDLQGVREVPVEARLCNGTVFTLGQEVRFAFSRHKGWDRAEVRAKRIDPALKDQKVTETCAVPDGCAMLALYAGAEIRFGKFVRTLGAHCYLYPGDWAGPIRVK